MGTVRQLQELLECTHQICSDSDSTFRRGVKKWGRQAPRVGQMKGQPGLQGPVQVARSSYQVVTNPFLSGQCSGKGEQRGSTVTHCAGWLDVPVHRHFEPS